MRESSGTRDENQAAWPNEERYPVWANVIALLIWLLAGALTLVPFARDTSPWNAVTLRVPGDQGNWWHVLVGAPFFLAFPMIWLRLRALFSSQLSTRMGRRVMWWVVGASIAGTTMVQIPFLLHLAGTSEWQRFAVLSLGFGIMIASAILLFVRRRHISPTWACLVGLETAYLANAALCLIVYSEATGSMWSRCGWLVSMVLVWPIALELCWLFLRTFGSRALQFNPREA